MDDKEIVKLTFEFLELEAKRNEITKRIRVLRKILKSEKGKREK